MFDPVLKNPWVRAGLAVAAFVLIIVLAYFLRPVLVPLFFAFLVAYVLDPVVDAMERRKISRSVGVGALAGLGIAFLLSIPLLIVPRIITEADMLMGAASEGLQQDGGVYGWIVDRLPLDSVVETMGWAPEGDEEYDPVDIIAVQVAEFVRGPAVEFPRSHASQIATAGQSAGGGVARFFQSIGSVVVGLILFLGNLALFSFVAAYLLKDYDGIIAQAGELVPMRFREPVGRIFRRIDSQLRGFLRGQFIVCMCLGLMYTVGLLISGVPFAILLGAFGAMASFVPYLGIVLTAGPAIVLCLLQYQGIDWHLGGVIITFAVAQAMEGNVLTPKIVGDQVGLGPVWVMLAVLVFGTFLGFLGLLLAVPIAAVLKVLVEEAVSQYRESDFFQEEPDASEAES